MPIGVSELFKSADLSLTERVSWGRPIPDDKPGVYVVSLSRARKVAPIDLAIVRKWISRVRTLELDGSHPTPEALKERLSKFWFPDEVILYIGKAWTSVKKRVGQYYRTKLGDPKPHHGGHWIKTLSILNKLNVSWALTDKPEDKEKYLLEAFAQHVSEQSKLSLYDPRNPLPFANLEYPKGNSKMHGITGSVNRDD